MKYRIGKYFNQIINIQSIPETAMGLNMDIQNNENDEYVSAINQ